MGQEAIKLELIEWLSRLNDSRTIEYLKSLKDSALSKNDWWDDLSEEERQGIERGLKDIENGHTVSHKQVKSEYGL